MICEKILGSVPEETFQNCKIDYVPIEWHEAFKKLHKKVTVSGRDIGIRLDNSILIRGLRQDDVLYHQGRDVIAVTIPPCKAIVITVDKHHKSTIAKVCYEIGNKHAALFGGENPYEFITPYNQPMMEMLRKFHGVTIELKEVKLDFNRSISSSINAHTH